MVTCLPGGRDIFVVLAYRIDFCEFVDVPHIVHVTGACLLRMARARFHNCECRIRITRGKREIGLVEGLIALCFPEVSCT